MGSVKKIEKILEEAIEENAKMSMSISYENKISEHIILNADEIEIINGYLLQISTDYTECSINLNDANINTCKEIGNNIIDIIFNNVEVSLGII